MSVVMMMAFLSTFYMGSFITHVLEQGPKFTLVVAHGFDNLFVACEIF